MTVARWTGAAGLALMLATLGPVQAQGPRIAPSTAVREVEGGPAPARISFPKINESDLETWLTYLASDELQGRQVFTEGYGIAAQYIAERLREWGVQPLGDHGSYFQIVKLQSYRVERRSSITVQANGRSWTFKDGEHVAFPLIGGGAQRLTFDGLEVAGSADAAGAALDGLLLAVMNPSARTERRAARTAAVPSPGPAALLEYRPAVPAGEAGERGRPGQESGSQVPSPDIAPTTARVDAVVPPRILADDEFFGALLASVPELRERLLRGEKLPVTRVPDVKVTIDVENVYQPLTTALTRNVVGLVRGQDPVLRDTYVLFGAHLDHVGYATSERDVRGKVNVPIAQDRIWNGADDDGSGTTAELAIAKAFATGPRPRRSVVFIWHAGEEADLYGSRFNADFPVVPLDKAECFLNIDMIGRNRDDDPEQANTLFVIGADRISTDLHNLVVETNATLPMPLKLDYEYNDPTDLNSFYTRSDHFSYASKGLPVAFFFTGTHRDYHANTDTADKILFGKQARVAQLIYEVGYSVADSPLELRRDNLGARTGAGRGGLLR